MLLPMWCKVLLCEVQSLLDFPLSNHFYQTLLLEMEVQLGLLVQNLRRTITCNCEPIAAGDTVPRQRTSGFRSLTFSIAFTTSPVCTAFLISIRSVMLARSSSGAVSDSASKRRAAST